MQVVRTKDSDIAAMNKSLAATNTTLEATRQEVSATQAALKVGWAQHGTAQGILMLQQPPRLQVMVACLCAHVCVSVLAYAACLRHQAFPVTRANSFFPISPARLPATFAPPLTHFTPILLTPLPVQQAAEASVAQLTTELGVTQEELTRTAAVAARAAAAEAKIVKAEGVVPAGGCDVGGGMCALLMTCDTSTNTGG